jgi:hypothetical protein
MKYLHKKFDCAGGETVRVALDKQANVRLLDDNNYRHFRSGGSYRYGGGLAKTTPVLLTVPNAGRWHVVVDLGGYAGSVRASIALLN